MILKFIGNEGYNDIAYFKGNKFTFIEKENEEDRESFEELDNEISTLDYEYTKCVVNENGEEFAYAIVGASYDTSKKQYNKEEDDFDEYMAEYMKEVTINNYDYAYLMTEDGKTVEKIDLTK